MAISVSSNAAQVSLDLGKIGYRATRRLQAVVEDAGTDVRDAWRDNLAESSGSRGPHAPAAIKAHSGVLVSEIYPDESMKQGGMSWEFGSENQPPHLDGQRALDSLAPRINRRIDAIVADLGGA